MHLSNRKLLLYLLTNIQHKTCLNNLTTRSKIRAAIKQSLLVWRILQHNAFTLWSQNQSARSSIYYLRLKAEFVASTFILAEKYLSISFSVLARLICKLFEAPQLSQSEPINIFCSKCRYPLISRAGMIICGLPLVGLSSWPYDYCYHLLKPS